VAKYFRALGDSTRLRILELLQAEPGRELPAGELGRRLGAPQPRVSNHLACLRWCGFVATRRVHRVVYYRLADQRVAAMLDLAHGLLGDNAEHVAVCCRIEEPGIHCSTTLQGQDVTPMPAPMPMSPQGDPSQVGAGVEVEVLTLPGCPHRAGALRLVERICAELGMPAEVRVIDIADPRTAAQARFLGSPTIRVNGHDIEPGADQRRDYVYACRLYPQAAADPAATPQGLAGQPDERWLRAALLAAACTAAGGTGGES